ncbi:MAG TPA: hypothetical protein VH088_14130 [Terriglobales bacterium]|nr:hypothetical protein [Terriglobales bacterium]
MKLAEALPWSKLVIMENLTVLSLSFNSEELARRAEALRGRGFEVVSVTSPAQARFEIEMGRCGIFLTDSMIADLVNTDLFEIFKRNCPDGVTVYVAEASLRPNARTPRADFVIPKSEGANGVVNALAAHFRMEPNREVA